ncbi:MAG: GNAT family N-acetyltransferase [Erysipelotrichaceae bacterium]
MKILTKEKFEDMFNIMDNSFPNTEMRTYEGQLALLDNPIYKIYYEELNNEVVAFIATFQLNNYSYIDHFAVSDKVRGTGIGSKFLKEYIKSTNKQIILEVERPINNIAIRRINFYERLGFNLYSYDYKQPPLRMNNPWIDLYIMSNKPLEEINYKEVKQLLYKYVYQVEEQ